MRFDPAKVLLDPYGRSVVVPKDYSRDAASREGGNAATAMKSVMVDPSMAGVAGSCGSYLSGGGPLSGGTVCRPLVKEQATMHFLDKQICW